MIPAVPAPTGLGGIRTPIDFKLKPRWSFVAGAFESNAGRQFTPSDQLPDGTEIVYKIPSLVDVDLQSLSNHERDLRRYMQVILPMDQVPEQFLDVVRAWPCVAEAHVAPAVSLPSGAAPRR